MIDYEINDCYDAFVKFRYRKDKKPIYCTKCGSELEWYYAENRLYCVRCSKCGVHSLVRASSSQVAMEKVGVLEKR